MYHFFRNRKLEMNALRLGSWQAHSFSKSCHSTTVSGIPNKQVRSCFVENRWHYISDWVLPLGNSAHLRSSQFKEKIRAI